MLVNEFNVRNISLNVRGVSFKVDLVLWIVGEYMFLCFIG